MLAIAKAADRPAISAALLMAQLVRAAEAVAAAHQPAPNTGRASNREDGRDADDEPLDDARTVAMTAAASAARVMETAARQAREQADRDRAQVKRRTEQAQAEAALRTRSGPSWDAQRPEREAARQNLTPEAREAFRVADLSTGIDPALAAAHTGQAAPRRLGPGTSREGARGGRQVGTTHT